MCSHLSSCYPICQARPIRPSHKSRWTLVLVGRDWRYRGYNWEMKERIRGLCARKSNDTAVAPPPAHAQRLTFSIRCFRINSVINIGWCAVDLGFVVVKIISMNSTHRIILSCVTDRRGLDGPLVVTDQWQYGWPNLVIYLRIGEAMDVFKSVYCCRGNPHLCKQ